MHSENMNRVSLAALGSILFAMLLVAFSNLVISPKRSSRSWLRAADVGARIHSRRRPRGAARGAAAGPARQGRRDQGPAIRQGLPDLSQFREGRGSQDRSAAMGRGGTADRLDPRLLLFRFAESGRRKLDVGSAQYDGFEPENGGVGHQDGLPGRKGPAEASRYSSLSPNPFGFAGPIPEVTRAGKHFPSRGKRNPNRSGSEFKGKGRRIQGFSFREL